MSLNWIKPVLKNHPAQAIAYGCLLFLTATQFTNCSGYASKSVSGSAAFECTTSDCVSPNVDNLKITPVVGNTGSYPVNHTASAFNIGGTCNEGGFSSNVVTWELLQNGVPVRSSESNVTQTGANSWGPANSKCVNGHFALFVNIGPDQSGTNPAPNGLGPGYSLRITISGSNATSAQLYQSSMSRAIVTLTSI